MDVPWNRRKLNCISVDNTHTALRHRLLIKIIHSYKADTSLDTQECHCHITSRSLQFQVECCSRGINTWNSSNTQVCDFLRKLKHSVLWTYKNEVLETDYKKWRLCHKLWRSLYTKLCCARDMGFSFSWNKVTYLSYISMFFLWQKVFSRYASLAFSWHTHIRDVLVDGDVVWQFQEGGWRVLHVTHGNCKDGGDSLTHHVGLSEIVALAAWTRAGRNSFVLINWWRIHISGEDIASQYVYVKMKTLKRNK